MTMLPVAILSGGLATRLRPITETIPKALVEVAGKPFIAWQLAYLQSQGISQVVICVGHLGEMIRDVVGNGKEFGLNVDYSEDGPFLLGTGGALAKAAPLLGESFFVLYGDSFLPVDFSIIQKAHEKSDFPALMTVLKNQDRWDKSNVLFQDGKLLEYNKHTPNKRMNYVDFGLGVVSESIFKGYLSGQEFDLADVYHDLSVRGELSGLEVCDRFYEIGSHIGLRETEEYLLMKENGK